MNPPRQPRQPRPPHPAGPERPGTRADLFRTLGVLAEPPCPAHPRLAGALGLPAPDPPQWTEALAVQLVPHASIYLGPEGMLGGEAADRIAGFWRALRLPVPADPDHLTSLLGLYATLLEAERDEPEGPRRLLWRQARVAMLHEHLLSWLLPYCHAMADVGPTPYARWARLLRQALRAEAGDVGPPDGLPAHLRDAPPPPGEPEDLDEMLDWLLVPVRSGVVLTRRHLAAVARELGLGLRLGDRRRMLRALVEQDAAAPLAALADRAAAWAARHENDRPATGPVARHWADRASATTRALRAAPPAAQPSRPTPPPRPARR